MTTGKLFYEDKSFTISRLVKSDIRTRRRILHETFQRAHKLNPVLNAFREISSEVYSEVRGPMRDIGIALKDLFYTQGVKTTGGSKILAEFVPSYDATVVTKLKALGAVTVGKTNMHEFAAGGSNLNPHYGPVLNPFDTERISGGSSGGSAVAVATGMSVAALGTDTAGSVRMPAALCRIVGFKPSFGAISRYGVIPLSWSLDHVGFLTRNVIDSEMLFRYLYGFDKHDPVTGFYQPLKRAYKDICNIRFGLCDYFMENIGEEVRSTFQKFLDSLRDADIEVSKVSVNYLQSIPQIYEVIRSSEAASYHEQDLVERPSLYSDEVRTRIGVGLEYRAVDYIMAQRARNLVAMEFAELFEEVDILLSPTAPIVAPTLKEASNPRVGMSLVRNTRPFDVTGQPAISIPVRKGNALPVGIQLAAGYGEDFFLLKAARDMERFNLTKT